MKKLLIVLSLLVLLCLYAARPQANSTVEYKTPTLHQLNTFISAAEKYYDGLYKPVAPHEAVVSEYYSLPLNAYFQKENKTVLLGQDTSITNYHYSYAQERSVVTYEAPEKITMDVSLTWNTNSATISLREEKPYVENVMILLGSKPLTVFWGNHTSDTITVPLDSAFQSNRYTVRHATQTGISYYKAIGNYDREDALYGFTSSFGLPFGYDLHSVIWGDSAAWSADFVYDKNVYYDCYLQFPSYQFAYAYRSKVCSLPDGPGFYIALSKTDSLVPTQEAIQNVERGQVSQAIAEDKDLEKEFSTAGFGLSTCPRIAILPPFYCTYNEESTIRTATFGVLEMKLGHISYADKVASLLVQHQITNGIISLPTGTYYRPLQTGAIPLSWNRKGQFVSGESTVYKIIGMFLNMNVEYAGPIITNAETQADALAFLLEYRCAKYKVCN